MSDETDRARAVSDQFGLSFHIAYFTVEEHSGVKSERRPATEEELEMWSILDSMTPSGNEAK